MPWDSHCPNAANVNRYEIAVLDINNNTVRLSHTLDYNLRLGFDATSTEALDTPDTSKPYLSPIFFGGSATEWKIDLVIPTMQWVGSLASAEVIKITVTDIWNSDHSAAVMFMYGTNTPDYCRNCKRWIRRTKRQVNEGRICINKANKLPTMNAKLFVPSHLDYSENLCQSIQLGHGGKRFCNQKTPFCA